jgi:hypothetical protein
MVATVIALSRRRSRPIQLSFGAAGSSTQTSLRDFSATGIGGQHPLIGIVATIVFAAEECLFCSAGKGRADWDCRTERCRARTPVFVAGNRRKHFYENAELADGGDLLRWVLATPRDAVELPALSP